MSTIGGGGRRVGGPPGPVAPPPVETPKAPEAKPQQTAPSDGFERGAQAPIVKKGPEAPQLNVNVHQDPKFNELLKQTRNDPKALNALAHTLNMAFNRFSTDFQVDRGKANALLDQLSQAKFAQGAVEHTRAELGSLRERMHVTKQRMATQKRRLRALKQLAGKVSDTRLAEEIAGIEARIEMLDTGWAESFVGLGLGKVIFQPQDEDAPEHLKNVMKASVTGTKRNQDAEALGEVVAEMHPARMVAQIAAREIDGTPKKKLSSEVIQRVRKEAGGVHGRTVQALAAMYELFENPEDEA